MFYSKYLKIFCACFFSLLYVTAHALEFQLPENGSTVLGNTKEATTITGDTLTSIGRRYSMGIVELMEANPSLKVSDTYGPGKKLTIPSAFILPNTSHKGIVINLAELRLYFYVPNTKQVLTFPVGVGRQGWGSPLGETYIARKQKDPIWIPTKHILDARLQDGVVLPKVVRPGPDNPLGPYALYTGVPAILIHGSNDPSGIGRRSSSGCIRMQPEAIERFFDLVPVNLLVTIVDEPIKVGWLNNDLYVEAHIPLGDDPDQDPDQLKDKLHQLVDAVIAKRPASVDWSVAEQTVKDQRGYPVKIGTGLGPIPQITVPLNPLALTHGKNDVHARKTLSSAEKKHIHKRVQK